MPPSLRSASSIAGTKRLEFCKPLVLSLLALCLAAGAATANPLDPKMKDKAEKDLRSDKGFVLEKALASLFLADYTLQDQMDMYFQSPSNTNIAVLSAQCFSYLKLTEEYAKEI